MNLNKAKDFCRSLPGVTEDIKWGDNLVFSVGEKMFAVMDDNDKAKAIALKVDDDRFLELTDRPGIIPAPYLARMKWVLVEDLAKLPEAEAKAMVKRSHELIFAKLTKKLQREIEGAA
ncbi:MmcQ/YjbR family DNA-binding protein [Pseudoduganella sp. DS3]|uniref:MmcQ/YjbR family DNA-binding protein n=1 Tax=Pseudoduganella guangdongensis TaxID=2692179 RepID=A0A6N9HCF4_9BURK|nr:MmcQ/YjbR family DNA-binding protein [Pseudoduganella guangdongensis]MYN01251.1 MmcQ/YjbR family DNA-binding protein [Pseudoduganella guangdongensis]